MVHRRMGPLAASLLFSALMAVVLWAALHGMHIAPGSVHALMLLWFAAITTGMHLWQEKALAVDPQGFVRRFMAGLMLKMIASLGVLMLVLLRTPKEELMATGLTFALLYLAFLAFSTIRLTGLSRRSSVP